MGGAKKLHVGFPEKALDKYLSMLVKHGFKVAVVEQTETPKMLEKRIKESNHHVDKCVNREVLEMVTRGTFQDKKESSGYEPKYILTYRKFQNTIGITFFDVTTLKIFIGQFEDDENLQNFRTLICQIRPVEIIQEKDGCGSSSNS
jgi:DNA mismatch repair protein MSH6